MSRAVIMILLLLLLFLLLYTGNAVMNQNVDIVIEQDMMLLIRHLVAFVVVVVTMCQLCSGIQIGFPASG
jgi:hypothetical protein